MKNPVRFTAAGALLALAALFSLAYCEKPAPAPAPATAPATPDAGAVAAPAPPSDGPAGTVSDAMAAYRTADEAFQQGKTDEALRGAEAAVKAGPSLPLAWNLLGRAAAKKFEATRDAALAKKAQDAWKRAVALDPNFLPAWQNLGDFYEKLGRPGDAAEAYGKVLALAPDHPDKARLEAFIQKAGAGK